jgi:hypothetical protein
MDKKACLVLLFLLIVRPAQADEFIKPTFAGMLQTMLRLNALSLTDDKVVDDYAIVTECKLYKAFYSDDFKWNTIRTAIRDSVAQNKNAFPLAYRYDAQLQLDRYDFEDKLFRFTDKTAIRNVNTLGLYRTETGVCPDVPTKHLPMIYRAVIEAPLSLAGLPLDQNAAQALLDQMKSDHNKDRIVYVRMNMYIVYIDMLRLDYKNANEMYMQSSSPSDTHAVRFDARLESIDFYEDEGMTKLIYTYKA